MNSEMINIIMKNSDKPVFGTAKPAGNFTYSRFLLLFFRFFFLI